MFGGVWGGPHFNAAITHCFIVMNTATAHSTYELPRCTENSSGFWVGFVQLEKKYSTSL